MTAMREASLCSPNVSFGPQANLRLFCFPYAGGLLQRNYLPARTESFSAGSFALLNDGSAHFNTARLNASWNEGRIQIFPVIELKYRSMPAQPNTVNRRTILSYLDDHLYRGAAIQFIHRRGLRTVQWSYEQIALTARRFARELEMCGIAHGDRVLLCGGGIAPNG